MTTRRSFLTLLGGAAAAWPVGARAQHRLPTIGLLGASSASEANQRIAALTKRLGELGWLEGRTITVEYRWAQSTNSRFQEIADEFVRLKVDLIFANSTEAVLAAKRATATIPIVFPAAGDPVGN